MNDRMEKLVSELRHAVTQPGRQMAVRNLLQGFLCDPENLHDLAPPDGIDEILYFEDEAVSIWNCRFHPQVLVPPHEHTMPVEIAAYGGAEKNILFQYRDGRLQHQNTVIVGAGEHLSLGAEVIHAVRAQGEECCLALHVYFGPLTQVKRGLFDWESGEKLDFSDENFARLTRPAKDFPAF